MNAIANQVIRASGKSVKNGGWPYFDGTFKEYPSFRRKFRTYQANYHQAAGISSAFLMELAILSGRQFSLNICTSSLCGVAWW